MIPSVCVGQIVQEHVQVCKNLGSWNGHCCPISWGFVRGPRPGNWSSLCLRPSASVPVTCLFCFPAFVWAGYFLCKPNETGSLWKKNPLPNCLNTHQCGLVFSLKQAIARNLKWNSIKIGEWNMFLWPTQWSLRYRMYSLYAHIPIGYRKLDIAQSKKIKQQQINKHSSISLHKHCSPNVRSA